MKIKILFPIVCLALLIAVPQAEAQSKRDSRKLKKEMRKLEKQMQKVQELKHDTYFPRMEQFELQKALELDKMEELKDFQFDMSDKHRQMAMEQAEKAKALAKQFREQNSERMHEYRELAKEHQLKATEELRHVLENQKHQLRELHQYFPDGIHFDEIEIPELDLELPEFDFKFDYKFPGTDAKYKVFDGSNLREYGGLAYTYDSDNNLSVKTDLEQESIDKTYEFTVADDASYLNLRANGSVSEGTVDIEIKTPQDEEYQSIELSPAADVDWSQKIKITDEKRESLKGKWKIRVKGDDVKGHFGLSLRSK